MSKTIKPAVATIKKVQATKPLKPVFKSEMLKALIASKSKVAAPVKASTQVAAPVKSKTVTKVKDEAATVIRPPLILKDTPDTLTVTKKGPQYVVELWGQKLGRFHATLLKRQEAYSLELRWTLWTGAKHTDTVMLPLADITKTMTLEVWMAGIVKQLIVYFLTPDGAKGFPHPCESQGDPSDAHGE